MASRSHLEHLHGDCNADNILVDGDRISIIDLDEAGLGEVCFDLVALLPDLEKAGGEATRTFFEGYREGGAVLREVDERAVADGLMMRRLGAALQDQAGEINVRAILEESDALLEDLRS